MSKKTFLLIIFTGLIASCKRDPNLILNGKKYWIDKVCLKGHNETKWSYHYGYSFMKHGYTWHFGPETKYICDSSRIDTTEIK